MSTPSANIELGIKVTGAASGVEEIKKLADGVKSVESAVAKSSGAMSNGFSASERTVHKLTGKITNLVASFGGLEGPAGNVLRTMEALDKMNFSGGKSLGMAGSIMGGAVVAGGVAALKIEWDAIVAAVAEYNDILSKSPGVAAKQISVWREVGAHIISLYTQGLYNPTGMQPASATITPSEIAAATAASRQAAAESAWKRNQPQSPEQEYYMRARGSGLTPKQLEGAPGAALFKSVEEGRSALEWAKAQILKEGQENLKRLAYTRQLERGVVGGPVQQIADLRSRERLLGEPGAASAWFESGSQMPFDDFKALYDQKRERASERDASRRARATEIAQGWFSDRQTAMGRWADAAGSPRFAGAAERGSVEAYSAEISANSDSKQLATDQLNELKKHSTSLETLVTALMNGDIKTLRMP